MKRYYLAVLMVLLSCQIIIGQAVTPPSQIAYPVSTNNQDAGDFVLTGFSPTATLLVSIGLTEFPSGTTLRLATTAGVTASTGYNLSNNFTRISFTGTQANANTVLASLQVNTGATAGNIRISVSATVNPEGYYYLPTNGHFYRPQTWPAGVSGGVDAYNSIKALCTGQTFKGQSGYLVTITFQDEQNFIHANVPGNNILIALTDNAAEGTFKWDAGPETGTVIYTGGSPVSGQFNNWCSQEPNNWGSGENFVVTKWSGGNCWNDFGPPATSFPGSISGYVVEFGTWSNPDNHTFTDFYSSNVSHQSFVPPTAPTSIAGTSTICSGQTTTLTAAGGTEGTGCTYQWGTGTTVGNNIIIGATAASYTTPALSENTTYWVRRVGTFDGTITGGVTQLVTVNTPPTAPTGISGTTTICMGQTTVLTATGGSEGSGCTYQWGTGTTVGSNIIAGATTASYTTPAITTSRTYWVRRIGAAPCNGTTTGGVTQLVTVNTPPTAPTTIGGTLTICSGQTTTLTADGGNEGSGATYEWGTGSTVGVNIISGANTASYTTDVLTSNTTFWVQRVGTAPCNTWKTGGVTRTITVNPLLQYRSKQSGNWTNLANWEQYNGISWVAATSYPGQIANACASPMVSVQAGHHMEVALGSLIEIPNLEIMATLNSPGKVTVKNGAKLTVQGQLQLDQSNGAAIVVE